MSTLPIAQGTAHKVPLDLRELLTTQPTVFAAWQNITPLARNEWICWIESAVKSETRERRMRILTENLPNGKHRPCCWAGCSHR